MYGRKGLAAATAAAAALAAAPAVASSRADRDQDDDGKRAETFEVTFTDLTSGQPLTPAVAATHRGKDELFRVGRAASFGLKEIAENGNNAPMLNRLAADRDVSDVVEAPGGPLVPAGSPGDAMFGQSTTFSIDADRGARFLSLASMLICTNDGFTGVNSLRLPRRVGDSVTVETLGYDAGTEANTEDFADMVPPCQALIGVSSGEPGTGMSDPALATTSVIRHHTGITGRRDLVPDVHGWDVNAPVARITVTATG
jgi:Spondin_N